MLSIEGGTYDVFDKKKGVEVVVALPLPDFL
jgi:hypothetical protein